MKLTHLFSFILCLLFIQFASAQKLSEQSFTVKGYNINEMGYPLFVTEGGGTNFVFLEYWKRDTVEGRREKNYYIQSYGVNGFGERWFKPVTDPGFRKMDAILGVKRIDGSYCVIGQQFSPEEKRMNTVGRFFSNTGKPLSAEPKTISNYDSKAKKGFEDRIVLSPNKKVMLWIGTDNKRTFASVWRGDGTSIWDEIMQLPGGEDEKMIVKDMAVDDEGNAFFLMDAPKRDMSIKDIAIQPILVRYDFRGEKYVEERISFDSRFPLQMHLELMGNEQVAVVGVLSDGTGKGLLNGVELKEERHWTDFFVKKYTVLSNAFEQKTDEMTKVPDEWLEHYGAEGSNFSDIRLMSHKNQIIMLFEEQYEGKKKVYYYDIACVALNTNTGGIAWKHLLEKKQRDFSPRYISYVHGIARDKLRLVYLTERGARGKIVGQSIDLGTGDLKTKQLASNEQAQNLFFPANSGMGNSVNMILIGVGTPNRNDYKLMKVTF